ncbi:MAG: ribosome maturation factor RimP [Endomicrobia bacterium]|nr:ribosome maturation factor RimP [Endomicrobiia bacterium]MCX7940496.1 ribosome maturation factor RimP [Endomicrobiia bacterium]
MDDKKELLNKLTELIVPVLETKNYDLVDLEYKPSAEGMTLTVYIDKDGGVTLKDCEDVSLMLSSLLDSYDIINESYILEVSSPGIYRELKKEKDFLRYLGHRIKVKLYEPHELQGVGKQKVFIGILKSYADEKFMITLDSGQEITFDIKKVAKVNLEPNITDLLKNK